MPADSVFSTNDLRSNSIDYKRDQERKHKWARGDYETNNGKIRPRGQSPQVVNSAIRRETGKHLASLEHREKFARKQDIVGEQCSSGDSSADEDVTEASAAPEPDAGVTYSFDAKRAPTGGSQVLSEALAKAVERFENHETDRLVKEQYEVLDGEGEVVERRNTRKGGVKVAQTTGDEDDYEFV
ncbi:MAG: hypothetical protein M1820_005616 [Bogoriella megaspora]|nr:MAG: hypothetical protein M1820_005616 [Bogoriella megaspora]